jgi:hypothetical protein
MLCESIDYLQPMPVDDDGKPGKLGHTANNRQGRAWNAVAKLLAFRDCLETKERALVRIAGYRPSDHRGHWGSLRELPCSLDWLMSPFMAPDCFPEGPDGPLVLAPQTAEKVHGIPRSVANLQDVFLHVLPEKVVPRWTQRFYEAIPEGADLSDVMFRFLYWALTDPAGVRLRTGKRVLKAIETVVCLYDRRIRDEDVPATEWLDASNFAREAWMNSVKAGRKDTLGGKSADSAALVEYSRAVGMSVEDIIEREGWAIGAVLCTARHINVRSREWTQRLREKAADALIEIVSGKAPD